MPNLTHEPRQARSRETLEKIVAATLNVARTSVDGNFTLREVADEAGIAQGTLHSRFPSKEELLLHVHELFCSQRLELLQTFIDTSVEMTRTATQSGMPARAVITKVIEDGLAVLLEDVRSSGSLRQVFMRAMIDSAKLAARHRQYQAATIDRTLAALRDMFAVVGQDVSDHRLRLAARLVVSALRESHPGLENPGLRLEDGTLLDELRGVILAMVPSTPTTESSDATTAGQSSRVPSDRG